MSYKVANKSLVTTGTIYTLTDKKLLITLQQEQLRVKSQIYKITYGK